MKANAGHTTLKYLYLFSSNMFINFFKTLTFSFKWGQPVSVYRTGKLPGLRVKTEKKQTNKKPIFEDLNIYYCDILKQNFK